MGGSSSRKTYGSTRIKRSHKQSKVRVPKGGYRSRSGKIVYGARGPSGSRQTWSAKTGKRIGKMTKWGPSW